MSTTTERKATDLPEIPVHMRMADDAELPKGWTMLSIPDASGDTRIMWDPRNKDDAKIAEQSFNAARARGMTVFLVDPETGEQKTGGQVTTFPKKEGKLIAVKQLQGG